MIFVAYAIAWICMTFLVYRGFCETGNWKLFWFMLIPLFISIHRDSNSSEETGKNETGKDEGEDGQERCR